MKRILLVLACALAVALGAEARTYALVTGVSNYGDTDINLTQTTKDAKRFKQVLETQTRDITLLTSSYATRANILEKLTAIANRAQAGDRIIFFFSGHGAPGAIYVYDGFLPYTDLMEVINSSAASEKICFIDACHAGSAIDADGGAYSTRTPGTALFVSSRPEEYSIESPWTGAGFFTQGLVKGMRGTADRDHDRRVTVKELFDYMYADVVRRSNSGQHPQLIAPREMYDVVVMDWTE